MSRTVEYVEVYPDGHEVVHHDSPLTKELGRNGNHQQTGGIQ